MAFVTLKDVAQRAGVSAAAVSQIQMCIRDSAKGILESWLLGQSGGPALADVIFGQVSPSGKLCLLYTSARPPLRWRHR